MHHFDTNAPCSWSRLWLPESSSISFVVQGTLNGGYACKPGMLCTLRGDGKAKGHPKPHCLPAAIFSPLQPQLPRSVRAALHMQLEPHQTWRKSSLNVLPFVLVMIFNYKHMLWQYFYFGLWGWELTSVAGSPSHHSTARCVTAIPLQLPK